MSTLGKYKSWVIWASFAYVVCVGFIIGLRFFFNDFSTPISLYLAGEVIELVILGGLLYGLIKNSKVLAVTFIVLNVLLFFAADHTSQFPIIQILLIVLRVLNMVAAILAILILPQLPKSERQKTILPTPVSTARIIDTQIHPKRVVVAIVGTVVAGFVSSLVFYVFLFLFIMMGAPLSCAELSISACVNVQSFAFLGFYIPLVLFLSLVIPLWKRALPFLARKLPRTLYVILFLVAIGALVVFGFFTMSGKAPKATIQVPGQTTTPFPASQGN